MAKYDSPGFAGAFPGSDPLDAGSLSNTQGSDGAQPGDGAGGMYAGDGSALGTVPVSHIFDSNVGNVPMATVHQGDTHVASNPLKDGISGYAAGSVTWQGTDGSSHVQGPSHPNAGR